MVYVSDRYFKRIWNRRRTDRGAWLRYRKYDRTSGSWGVRYDRHRQFPGYAGGRPGKTGGIRSGYFISDAGYAGIWTVWNGQGCCKYLWLYELYSGGRRSSGGLLSGQQLSGSGRNLCLWYEYSVQIPGGHRQHDDCRKPGRGKLYLGKLLWWGITGQWICIDIIY